MVFLSWGLLNRFPLPGAKVEGQWLLSTFSVYPEAAFWILSEPIEQPQICLSEACLAITSVPTDGEFSTGVKELCLSKRDRQKQEVSGRRRD